MPYAITKSVEEEIDNMLKKGVIEPSNSPWASHVCLVKNPDDLLRFCVDYRKLDECTRKDAYPLTRIEEKLDTVTGWWFCSMDLASGFWQVEMAEADKVKTAFCTRQG